MLEAQANYATKLIEIEKQKLNNVKNYYEGLVSYEQQLNKLQEKEFELSQAHGNYEKSNDYNTRIKNRQDELAIMRK